MEITGTREGDFLDEAVIARVILHPQGGFKNAPAGCKRIAVLNQADTPKLEAHANSIALVLLKMVLRVSGSPGCTRSMKCLSGS